jgi:hypothetical protein
MKASTQSDAACLHDASKQIKSQQWFARPMPYVGKQGACTAVMLQQALSGILQGAYGVVGFSRVKDERKGVFHCRRRASAGGETNTVQLLDNGWTTTGRARGGCWTKTGRLLCVRTVEAE